MAAALPHSLRQAPACNFCCSMPPSNKLESTFLRVPMALPSLAMENICTSASPTRERLSLPFLTVTVRNSLAGFQMQPFRVSPRKSRTLTKHNSSSAFRIAASALSMLQRYQLCLRLLPPSPPHQVFSHRRAPSLAELPSSLLARTSLLPRN